MLYSLSLFNERREGFFIGLFESHEKARQTAEYYRSAVPGFRDYPCTCEIREKAVIGTNGSSPKVHMFWGWDEDEEGNEVDIWNSDCYTDYADAQRAMDAARQRLNKQAWSLDTYQIGQCHWTEGFARIFDLEQEICPQSDRKHMFPRGITGFGSVNTEPPPFLDGKVFRQVCYALARENGGTVVEVNTDTTARNFYFAKLIRHDNFIFILQNSHYPYVAFAWQDSSGRFVLTSQPEWFRLPEGEMHFLSLAELNQDWRDLCGELSSEELEQICYWNPQTVGEIIFNAWD